MHINVLDPERAFLLVIDLQEAYRDKLWEWERIVERSGVLIRAARPLGLPVVFTEQYPQGLGHTTAELREALGDAPGFEKRSLSALGAPGLLEHVMSLGRRQAIVCGIETHACINQTVHDLLGQGFAVHVACDAVSSRRRAEHEIALTKMLQSGAVAGSVESIALECLRSADHPEFKSVQALLK